MSLNSQSKHGGDRGFMEWWTTSKEFIIEALEIILNKRVSESSSATNIDKEYALVETPHYVSISNYLPV